MGRESHIDWPDISFQVCQSIFFKPFNPHAALTHFNMDCQWCRTGRVIQLIWLTGVICGTKLNTGCYHGYTMNWMHYTQTVTMDTQRTECQMHTDWQKVNTNVTYTTELNKMKNKIDKKYKFGWHSTVNALDVYNSTIQNPIRNQNTSTVVYLDNVVELSHCQMSQPCYYIHKS